MHTNIHTQAHTYTQINIHTYTQTCMTHTYIHTHIHTYTRTYMHVPAISVRIVEVSQKLGMHICTRTHTYIHTTHTHTHLHTHAHTYIHTHIHACTCDRRAYRRGDIELGTALVEAESLVLLLLSPCGL